MSAYFDGRAIEIADLRGRGLIPLSDEVTAWVDAVIADIALAGEFDRGGPAAFPDGLRDAAYRVLLTHAAEAWPSGTQGGIVDYTEDDQGMALLCRMIDRLHDIYHAAAHAGWPGADDPRWVRGEIRSRMADRCDQLLPSLHDVQPGGRLAVGALLSEHE